MKKYIIITLLAAIAFACSRDDDETTTVDTQFTIVPMYAGEPLVTYKNYEYTDSSMVSFSKISLFISHIELKSTDQQVFFSDVEKFVYEAPFSNLDKAAQGISLDMGKVKPGNYELSFGIGVDSLNNSKTNSDFAVDHPLGDGEYWEPWGSYIFTKEEGVYIQDTTRTNFTYHTGSDGCYTRISVPVTIELNKSNCVVRIDFKESFRMEDGSLFYIPDEPQLHKLEQTPLALFFCDNIHDATTVAVE